MQIITLRNCRTMNTFSSPRVVSTFGSSEPYTFWLRGKVVRKICTALLALAAIYIYAGLPAVRIRPYRGPNSPGFLLSPRGMCATWTDTPPFTFIRHGYFWPISWNEFETETVKH